MISILEKVINHRISGFMFSSDRFSDTSPVYWGELLEDKNSISLPRAPVRMWICALKHSKTSWNISNQLFFLETFQINCFLESWFPGPFSKRLSWCSHGLLNIFLNLQLYDFDFVNLCLVNSNSIHAQFSGDRTALKRGAWQWKPSFLALLLEFIPYGMQVYMLANHRRSGWTVIRVKAFALACGCSFTLPCVMW